MQLPVDVKALVDEATDIDEALATPIALSIYIDEDAPADLAAHVRGVFASESPKVRMSLSYCAPGTESIAPLPTDDMAVLVAGVSDQVGAWAAQIRAVGVPVMVVTTMPQIVAGLARAEGHAIPDGDLAYPEIDGATLEQEPYALDADLKAALDERMGRWIVAACNSKRLAFAISFSFVRRPLANDAVLNTALQNAAIGLIPFIPGADLPLMTLNQAKMALQIAAAYGQAMGKERLKEMVAVVGGAFVFRTVARGLAEFIPVLGFVIRPGIGYAGTTAIGFAIIEYFEGGENLTGVANALTKAWQAGAKAIGAASGAIGKLTGSSEQAGKIETTK